MKSKQIILLHLKGCMLSDFSSELKFKSIGWKCSVFLSETYLWTITEQTPYWLETCLFNVLLFKAAWNEVCRFLLRSWLGQGCGEVREAGALRDPTFGDGFSSKLLGENPCPPWSDRGVGSRSTRQLCPLPVALPAQALLVLVAVPKCSFQRGWWGNKGANKIWMLHWLLVPSARGARAAWKGLKSTSRSKYWPGCACLNRCCVLGFAFVF